MVMSILSIKFTVARGVRDEARDRVWGVMRKIDDMPKYWRGHREVSIVGLDGNDYLVKVKFAFPGPMNSGLARITVNDEAKRVVVNYLKGPIRGYVVNELSGGKLVSTWEVNVAPLFILMKPWIRRHLMEGASNALTRIINQAEAPGAY